MKIFINNQPEELTQPQPVSAILNLLQVQHTRGLAIAVNNQIVPKTNWQAHLLQDNDKVTVIRATQGG
ncbi:sulfur carrier protein ThiS [Pontibacter sp. SGAir0037]|uniref:sulfur carrier protein ThiS n=1 Tax=Pontibacter sp. SGAir0037 TaxID=2571030 RepID=UPI0010CD0ACD|nr:sulfur carrier protein ThiS [Pontibacter sp. SGAir0037]QCR24544.1 thiamine biosynthesis protein ThiS [Pontibacter sp. SGAir0037]